MSIVYPVRKGAAYFAGMNLPFFVSPDAVRARARELGFAHVLVTPRREARFAFDVQKVPGYRDDWDTTFFGIYEGRAPSVTLPAPPSWLMEVRQQLPPVGKQVVAEVVVPKGTEPAPSREAQGGKLLLVLAGGVAVWIFAATITSVRRRAG